MTDSWLGALDVSEPNDFSIDLEVYVENEGPALTKKNYSKLYVSKPNDFSIHIEV